MSNVPSSFPVGLDSQQVRVIGLCLFFSYAILQSVGAERYGVPVTGHFTAAPARSDGQTRFPSLFALPPAQVAM